MPNDSAKEDSAPSTCSEHVSTPRSVLIPDVIHHLSSFVATQDLRELRLVSKSWNYAVTPVLKARTKTILKLDGNMADIKEQLEFSPINLYLLVEHPNQPFTLDPATFPSIRNLKSIYFSYIADRHGYLGVQEVCRKIVLASSGSLQELKFEWDNESDVPSFESAVFPKLRNLGTDYFSDDDDAIVIKNLGHAITQSFPNLEHLAIGAENLHAIWELGLLPKFPRSLSSITLDGPSNLFGLECLFELPGRLKRLIFDEVHLEEIGTEMVELPTMFYKLLKKHSQTLEELCMDIYWELSPSEDTDGLDWKFPMFSAMKTFKLCSSNFFRNIEFENSLGYFGEIDYETCFPVLETLHVSTEQHDVAEVACFFPSGDIVVDWVKDVDIKIYTESDFDFEQASVYTRLFKIFPNARDSVVKQLRKLLLE